MAYWALPALYSLTMNELRRLGTKAALKEIAKRTAKTLKKEGLKTTKYKTGISRVGTVDLTKLKTAHPLRNRGVAAGTTLGAAAGYVAGRSDAEKKKKKKKKKTKPSMTWNK